MRHIAFTGLALSLLLAIGCGVIDASMINSLGSSQASAQVVSINPSRLGDVNVIFYIDVTPTNATPNSSYFVSLVSRDGHFFDRAIVGWTEAELKGPNEAERDYNKIQQITESRTKHITLGAPISDKDIVLLRKDYQAMLDAKAEESARQIQSDVRRGDLVDVFKHSQQTTAPTTEEINRVVSRYLVIYVTDKQGFYKLRYPDAKINVLATYKGQGISKTAVFTPAYSRLRINWTGSPSGPFKEELYTTDGRSVGSARGGAEPKNSHGTGATVEPGKMYYFVITAPPEMSWEMKVEETNAPVWIDEK